MVPQLLKTPPPAKLVGTPITVIEYLQLGGLDITINKSTLVGRLKVPSENKSLRKTAFGSIF